jgi:intracellular multiplication protein IcmE
MSDDDFETDDFDLDGFDDGGFDDLNDQKGTLGDLWRNNPLVKIGIILGAVLLFVGGIVMFGGETSSVAPSRVAGVRDLTEAPGTSEVSEVIRQATEEETVRRTEEAIRAQNSAMPTPIDPPKGTIGLQFDEPEEEDPLERWRRMQEERIKQQQFTQQPGQQATPEPEPVDTRTPAVNALAGAISQQMGSILGAQQLNGPLVKSVTAVGYLEAQEEAERQALANSIVSDVSDDGVIDNEDLNIILPAGTIEYAQMITEANTDAPGPILAQIVSGPLKGGRMIGSFTAQDNYLTLTFSTIVLDGIDFAANGIAIDPNTTLPGVVTDIDRRYFKRIILPAAAEFVTGLTEAIANSGTTTVTVSGDSSSSTTSNDDTSNDQEVASGIEAAGEEISDILDEIVDDVEPLLRVRAGTPIGVLFTSPVVGTPQLVQQREKEEQERERLLRFPSGSNFFQ